MSFRPRLSLVALFLVAVFCTLLPQTASGVGYSVSFTSANNATFTVGSAGTFSVTTTGNGVPTFSALTPLPSWLTLNAGSGLLSGTPVLPGVYTFTLRAIVGTGSAPPGRFAPDGPVGGATATQVFTLTVNPLIENVGSAAPSYPVTVTFANSATLASVNVLTLGTPNLDFTEASDSCSLLSHPPGDTCVVNVVFKPTTTGLRPGAVVLEDASGNVVGIAYIGGIGSGPQVALPGMISTIAGTGASGNTGDGGLATNATLSFPRGMALDGAGNLYIADYGSSVVRKITASSGLISTVAGDGTSGYTGDGGPATSAELKAPIWVALDGAGNLYISDLSSNVIRKVTASTGIITTVAGNGTPTYSGDNGAATSASLYFPAGLALDVAGNLYIADEYNSAVRKVTASTGVITTVAGTGGFGYSGDGGAATSAQLARPIGVALDATGNLYLADSSSGTVRKVTASTGVISAVAGTGTSGYSGDGGAATSAQLNHPAGIAVDGAGDLFIADYTNNVIRKVAAGSGIITTAVGTGNHGYAGDGGSATNAELWVPTDVILDSAGNLYISDTVNSVVREVNVIAASVNFPTATNIGATDGTDGTVSVPVTNIGNADLNFTALSFASDFPEGSDGTDCAVGTAVTSGNSCNLPITFAPLQAGALSETLTLADNALNGAPTGTQTVALTGTGVKITPVETVSFSSNPLAVGNDETVTVTLAGSGATPTGTVRFVVNSTLQAPVALVGGQATLQLTAPAAGPYVITAYYSGDSSYLSSVAKKGLTVLKLSPTDTLVATPSPAVLGSLVTVTFTVPTIAGIAPTGTVKLSGASATAQTLTLTDGVATYQTSSLGVGNHALIATYSGDANYTSSRLTATAVVSKATSTTSVVSSNSPQVQKTAVTFTATATGSVAGVTPTGTMQFYIDSVLVGTKALVGGQASYTTKALLTGRHPVYAVYLGDSHYTGSTSTTIIQGTL